MPAVNWHAQLRDIGFTDMEIQVKRVGKSLTGNFDGEDVLFRQYGNPALRGSSLGDYLEGVRTSDEWVQDVARRTSRNQPQVLYRLCVVPKATQIGSILQIHKDIISASDKESNAKYAGCSYHHDQATDLVGMTLALIKIVGANVCISHEDILHAIEVSGHSDPKRAKNEREYIVSGPVSGEVIELLDVGLVSSKGFKQFLIA